VLESSSPIIDFYPTKFLRDLNGELKEWMSVPLLPFVDKNRLIKAMREADDNL
jgi:5'-3' exonuclease